MLYKGFIFYFTEQWLYVSECGRTNAKTWTWTQQSVSPTGCAHWTSGSTKSENARNGIRLGEKKTENTLCRGNVSKGNLSIELYFVPIHVDRVDDQVFWSQPNLYHYMKSCTVLL